MSRGTLRAQGDRWEARAAEYLESHGLTIIARGYRCRLGEIDIIGYDGDTLIVVEVRSRSRTRMACAVETVGPAKQRRIIGATRHYLMRNPQWFSKRIRFDVFAFDKVDEEEPAVRWVKNAFGAS